MFIYLKEEEINGQSERIKELERQLKLKDAEAAKVSRTHFERMNVLEEKLQEASKASEVMRENAKDVVKSEMKKMMSSTAKVLLAQFVPDDEYTGETAREMITDTLRQITVRIIEKYDKEAGEGEQLTKGGPPVATVIPITTTDNSGDDSEGSSGEEEWQEGDQLSLIHI